MILLKRAQDESAPGDGVRFLVERLWPRGVKKSGLPLDSWLKDAAPSDVLRRWFAHDPKRWDSFRSSYFRELDHRPQSWQPIAEAARKGAVTLIFSAHDTQFNNAVALKEYIEARIGKDKRPGK